LSFKENSSNETAGFIYAPGVEAVSQQPACRMLTLSG
jgi:hypothetical protein